MVAEEIGVKLMRPYTIRYGTGYSWTVIGRRLFRSVENRLADGRRDPHRSRYWINGCVVKHAKYQRERMKGGR